MTEEPTTPRPPLTNAWWYFAAAAIVLLAPMIGAMVAASSWSEVRSAAIQPIRGPITPAGKGIAIFSDLDQHRAIVCVEQVGKSDTKTIEPAQVDLTVDRDGSQWHLVAVDASPGDRVGVKCSPKDGRADNASYGYALVGGFGAAKVGMAVSVGGALVGVLLALTVAWRRAKFFRPSSAE